VVALLGTLYVVSCIDRLVLAVLIQPLKAELHITDTQVALLIGPTFALLYAGLGLPVAWLTDRGNRTRIAAAGIVIWSLSTVGAGFAGSFAVLLALRMGVAIGEAVLSPVAVSLIADHFARDERPVPIAVFVSAGVLGVMAAYAVGGGVVQLIQGGYLAGWPILGAMTVWRATLVVIGVPGILLAALLLFTTREPVRGAMDSTAAGTTGSPAPGAFISLSKAVRFYGPFLFGNSIFMMITYGALAWYPTYLVRRFDVSVSNSGYLFSIALGVAACVTLLISIAAKSLARRGRHDSLLRIELWVLPAGAALFAAALVQHDLQTTTIFTVAGMGLMSGINGLNSIAIGLTAPPHFRGRLMAVGLVFNNVIGLGLGPLAVALLSKHVFSGEQALGPSLLTMVIIASPIAWLLILSSLRPYRAAMTRLAVAT
jgi:MFS family permease